jgi:MoaA/NifB/PqqE/SkfB family radical SAM enzyme
METLKNIISYAKANRCACLSFTGGEPTLHPRFSEIVETVDKNNLTFAIITNGKNFPDIYQSIDNLEGPMRSVDFSLDGATEDMHDLNRGRGGYRDVLRAVSICRYRSIPFGIRMTVTKRNINQLEEMSLLAAKLGARELFFLPLQPTPLTASMKLLLDPADLDMIQDHVLRLRKIFRIKITLTAGYKSRDHLFACPTLTTNDLFITAADEAGFCCHLANYRGGIKGSETIANFKKACVSEAHQLVKNAVTTYKRNKIKVHNNGKLRKADYYTCWYCLKYFRKVDWMAEYPDNQWSADLLEHRSEQEDNYEMREKIMISERCK